MGENMGLPGSGSATRPLVSKYGYSWDYNMKRVKYENLEGGHWRWLTGPLAGLDDIALLVALRNGVEAKPTRKDA